MDLQLIGGIIGLLACVPLFIGICINKVKQSFVTYLLWGVLDAVSAMTTFLQDGNYWLPLFYAIGSLFIAGILLVKKLVVWGKIEKMTVGLVFATLLVWWIMGNEAALIASIVSLAIASVPQVIDTYNDPDSTPTKLYFIFLAANAFSFAGGESWTIAQKLYPGNALIFCLFITLLSMRKSRTVIYK